VQQPNAGAYASTHAVAEPGAFLKPDSLANEPPNAGAFTGTNAVPDTGAHAGRMQPCGADRHH
jgi:hypothetical protein